MIWRIAYISRRCVPDDDLEEILTEARARNASEDISGVLLADRTHFVQVVEGTRPAIADLTLRLMGDARHAEVRFLASGPDEVRWFSDWTMAFVVPGRQNGALKKRFATTDFASPADLFETLMATVERAEAAPTGLVRYG